jgi:hypothetical protein
VLCTNGCVFVCFCCSCFLQAAYACVLCGTSPAHWWWLAASRQHCEICSKGMACGFDSWHGQKVVVDSWHGQKVVDVAGFCAGHPAWTSGFDGSCFCWHVLVNWHWRRAGFSAANCCWLLKREHHCLIALPVRCASACLGMLPFFAVTSG